MRLFAILFYVFLTGAVVNAQEADNLDSLSIPDEPKSEAGKKTDTDLSLPAATTATVGKSNPLEAKRGKNNVGAILDFEGEVIEGERRRPDLFLQISIDNIKFDSLIYNREDFNDYLEVDRKSRTRFLKMK